MRPKLPDSVTQAQLDSIAALIGLQTQAAKIFMRLALENTILMDRKQLDYGSRNISGFGLFGVIVRMNDKFERIKNLFAKRRRKAQNESVLDSFDDISNYAIIARMVATNQWPNE